MLSSGTCAIIESIQIKKLSNPETTYNFEVEDYHTYYVTESKVLVHNDCGVKPTQKGVDNVKDHISSNNFDSPENSAMIERLQNAVNKGQKIYGADKNFYMHELKEMTLMRGGMGYDAAHKAALAYYNVSNYALYHPSVIAALPEYFSTGFFNYWGIMR